MIKIIQFTNKDNEGKYMHAYSYFDLFGIRMQNSVFGNNIGFFHFIPSNPTKYRRYDRYFKINNYSYDLFLKIEFNKNCVENIIYNL